MALDLNFLAEKMRTSELRKRIRKEFPVEDILVALLFNQTTKIDKIKAKVLELKEAYESCADTLLTMDPTDGEGVDRLVHQLQE